MKLSKLLIFAFLLPMLLTAAPGVAQEDEPAESPAGDVAESEAADAEAERQQMVEAIRDEMGLPAQADTGVRAPDIWMPVAASEQAAASDRLFWFVMWVTVFFTVLITVGMIWFAIRYRHREGDPDPEGAPTHSTTLEITWTVIPTCIVLVMFVMGFKGFLETTVPPQNPYTVTVTGRMWSWSFTYPNGAITPDLHIPKDRPVRFVLRSEDVIHSFFVPAFRLKKDVVPGRENSYWVEPNREGIYDIFCTEYCGTNHSRMIALCFVYEQDRYGEMLARISDVYTEFPSGRPREPEEVGRALYQQRGCAGCHSTDGSNVQAPSWQGLWMSERPLADGSTVVADRDYIRESIFYPQRQIVQGFGNAMPSALGQLSERDIDSIVAYIQSLSDDAKETAEGETITADESQSIPEDDETGRD